MKAIILFNILIFLFTSTCGGYETYLDPEKKILLIWTVDYSTEIIYFKVVARIHDHQAFGMGFSDYGETTSADYAVFWTDSTGAHNFEDMWTDGNGILHSDLQQDLVLTNGRSTDAFTQLEFYRKFDTCDNRDYILDNGTTHTLYFITNDRRRDLNGVNVTALENTGFERIQLLRPDFEEPLPTEDTWHFDIVAPKAAIPPQETTYWWYTAELPAMFHKHHITIVEAIISRGSEHITHHMEVFHCALGPHESIPYMNAPGLEGERRPSGLSMCRHVIAAWAMGAKPLVYPKEAGMPVGGREYSKYVLLEIHYNNPSLVTGVKDSSGFRFHVTPTLRRYDIGIMEVGLEYTDKMAIPPRQPRFGLTGYCPSHCTAQGLPLTGIYVVASQLHTHLTGKTVYTKHVRNGRELPEVNRDNHYSPHMQEIRILVKPVHVLPGDDLITVCEDSTLDRENVTFGGASITDEMCVNYMHYYPRSDLELCKSSVNDDSLNTFFKFMNKWEDSPTSPHKSVRENYSFINWNPLNVHLLKNLYRDSPISVSCNSSSGQSFTGEWRKVKIPTIRVPAKPPQSECKD